MIVAHGACLEGPNSEYQWNLTVSEGDKGIVVGRAPIGNWLWVRFNNLPRECWVGPSVVQVEGDLSRVTRVTFERINSLLPRSSIAVYQPPTGLTATRDGDQVTVSWDPIWMTEDDDRGYTLDVLVCQNGNLIWYLVGRTLLPTQTYTSYTFTDQAGCAGESGGVLYAVEKHGYIFPALTIPWPPVNTGATTP